VAKKSLNIAVIGLGMGKGHLRDYSGNPNARPVALCDLNTSLAEAQAAEASISTEACYSDYKKLLADASRLELDAVSVALPNALHAPVTLAALKAGLHVLCEKPMAMKAAEARKMKAQADQAGKVLMINFSFRFRPQSMALKKIVEEGAVGDLYYGRTVWHRRRGMPKFGGWFGRKELSGGGPIIDLGVHRMDLAMWLMGCPRPVTVSASTYNVIGAQEAKKQGKKFDVEDLGCALIRFETGATLILEASWAGFSEKREDMVTQLWGTKGGIVQRNVGQGYEFEAKLFREEGEALWSCDLQQPLGSCPSAYEEFVSACLEQREPIATAQHGINVQEILDAVYKSARMGKEVRITRK
jgi:predicted dehydrogenase